MPSLWELHVNRWSRGCGDMMCEHANRVCLARGSIPADILLVGEAPGPSEDVLGLPFCGPAGQLLDSMIVKAGWQRTVVGGKPMRWCCSNLCGCIPKGEDGVKFTEPDDSQIEQCKPRLIELVGIVDPKLIVCVGKLATDWLEPGQKHSIKLGKKVPQISVKHPSWLLRCPDAQRGLEIQRCVIALKNAAESLEGR